MSAVRHLVAACLATACSAPRAPAPAAGVLAPENAADAAPAMETTPPGVDAAPSSSGPPSDEELERALGAANPKLEACRSAGLAQNARLSGHVRFKIRVGAEGHVEGVDDQGSSLPSPTVVACFADAVRTLQLPRDAHAYEIVKTYTVLPPPDVWPTARDGGASR